MAHCDQCKCESASVQVHKIVGPHASMQFGSTTNVCDTCANDVQGALPRGWKVNPTPSGQKGSEAFFVALVKGDFDEARIMGSSVGIPASIVEEWISRQKAGQ